MEWKDLKGIVGNAAPLLGNLLGGPAGATVGALVSSVLGVDNSPDEVHKALEADPEKLTGKTVPVATPIAARRSTTTAASR